LGGINSLWPLFGIANQMLATIALCLVTTIILKMSLGARSIAPPESATGTRGAMLRAPASSPALAFITLLPLVWLLSVTFTAGIQKVWHSDPRIGFISGAAAAQEKREAIRSTLATVPAAELAAKNKEVATLSKQVFNLRLDAFVAIAFLVLVSIIIAMSVWEWVSLLSRRKPAVLHESEPIWLPDYAVTEGGRKLGGTAGAATLAVALAKELSGETQLERAAQQAAMCDCSHAHEPAKSDAQIYVETTEKRFTGVRRCC
jgi:carbon starvation protein